MIFARKIDKIPEFYIIFARKMAEFYTIIARKYFFPNFGGHVPPCLPSPTPMLTPTKMAVTQLTYPAGMEG